MKKIAISLGVIGVVAAIVIGATTAYFSDTETSVGNTFSAGTIDIDIDGQNPWTETYHLGDLKPSETAYINFRINNVGQNPVNISKKLYDVQGNGGVEDYPCPALGTNEMTSSEPECEAEEILTHREDDIQKVTTYDLSVEVYTGADVLLWWQTIYSDAEGKSIADVYGTNGGNYIDLGMIPFDGYMLVTQSYHLSGTAENEYQGDGLTFNIEIKGEQLNQEGGATVTLEDKDGNPDWNIIQGGAQGTLTYQTKGPEFDYSFTASGLTDEDYQLIYYPDPWSSNKQVVLIGSAMTATGGSISASNSVELGMDLPDTGDANHPEGAKIWLVPTISLSGSTLSWTNTDKFLFETRLITYDDTDI